MNFWGTVAVLTFNALVLQIVAAQESLGLSLCLNILGGSGGCKNGKNAVINDNPTDAMVVLENGFSNCYKNVLAAENRAMNGFSLASKLISTQPENASKAIQEAIQESKDMFYQSGMGVFLSMGKALGLSNEAARQGLIESTQGLQVVSLHVLDELRMSSALAIQGVQIGGEAATQEIETIRQNIQFAFVPVYDQLKISYQKAIKAVAYAQSNPMTPKVSSPNAVNNVKDTDARAAISQIIEAAANSIRRGSTASKVNQLSEALIRSIAQLAEDVSFVRNQAVIIQKLTPVDNQSSAKNSFLKGLEAVNNRIQMLFVDICLDFGSAAVNLSEQQIGKALTVVEYGDDEVNSALELAKEIVLFAFKQEGNERKLVLDAAVQVARYGQNTYSQRIFEGAEIVFNVL